MAIQISGVTVIDNSSNIKAGIGTFDELNVKPLPIIFSPTDGATDQSSGTNIVITFGQAVSKGTGNITLRDGSAGGTILQTIDVTSGSVTISGGAVTIDPPSSIPSSTNVYVVVDAGAFLGILGTPNDIINTYNFTIQTLGLGDAYEGGYLICEASSVRWIVAPNTSEVTRNWYARDDANTRAQQVSGCTGWFVPTCAQLQNPGYTCRTYWDSYASACYWSSTECNSTNAWFVNFTNGITGSNLKSNSRCVRAFRCVTY